jgi:hypothetical protein
MGHEPLGWADLRDCAALLRFDLGPWDYEALRLMSVCFLREQHIGADVMARSPLDETEEPE